MTEVTADLLALAADCKAKVDAANALFEAKELARRAADDAEAQWHRALNEAGQARERFNAGATGGELRGVVSPSNPLGQ